MPWARRLTKPPPKARLPFPWIKWALAPVHHLAGRYVLPSLATLLRPGLRATLAIVGSFYIGTQVEECRYRLEKVRGVEAADKFIERAKPGWDDEKEKLLGDSVVATCRKYNVPLEVFGPESGLVAAVCAIWYPLRQLKLGVARMEAEAAREKEAAKTSAK